MAYVRIPNRMAELGKLSQGKKTITDTEFIARWAIGRIRELERTVRADGEVDELERMFHIGCPLD